MSENEHILQGLTLGNIAWAFTTGHAANWHPITWLSLMLDCQLFGPNPGWIHLINVFLHIANSLLLFAVLKKMTGALWPSAFVSALFAIHPMHVESVAWIAERKDVLSTLFLLLTLAAYVGYVKSRSLISYLLVILLYALGLLAKPMLVTLPFLLLLLDYWPLNRFEIAQSAKLSPGKTAERQTALYRLVIEKIPFFILSAISSIITFLVQQSGGAVTGINSISFENRVANAFLSYVRYIIKMVWPQNLSVFYPPDIESFSSFQIVLCAVLLFAISVFVIYFARNKKYLLTGWLWFIVTLIPVIGLIQVGYHSMADRYTYISYIGLFIMIAWGLPELLSKWQYRKIFFIIFASIVLAILGVYAHRQVSYWKNTFTLFSHATNVTQNNFIAYINIGVAYSKLGRYQDTIDAYKQSIRIYPNFDEAHNSLGVAYANLGRYEDAVNEFKQAVRINPDFAEAHYNLGLAYANLGRYQDAIESLKVVIRIKPDHAEAYNNLGAVYGTLGRYQDSIEAFEQALRIKPDYAEPRDNLAIIYDKLGIRTAPVKKNKQ